MSNMKYPINCKGADPILTPGYEVITLHQINDILSAPSIPEQMELCNRLGITITNNNISIIVSEKGRAYQSPDEDRTIISDTETNYEFQLNFSLANCQTKFPLPFKINFGGCAEQVFVNFYAEIVFLNQEHVSVSVPLIGRGTAALEGRENDAHADPCVDGNCASFQQKVALLVSILAFFRMTRDDIEIFRAHLLKNCDKFYGRNDILNYTIDKAFSLTTLSYYEYLKKKYAGEDDENVPIMLQHFIDFSEPHPLYFECLQSALTPEELCKELKDTSNDPFGPDKKPITVKVREIINKLIFLDEIYMIKPYSGDNFKNKGNEEISIYEIAKCINNSSIETAKALLQKIGVTISDNKVNVTFTERGIDLALLENKNAIAKDQTEEMFELECNVPSVSLECLLSLKVYLDINPIDNINFFGKLEIKNGFMFNTIVPLLGRGTIALDGRLNAKHAGFVTNAKTAAFQQRIAIIYTVLVILNVNQHDLQRFESLIRKINNKYFGLENIIDYTFKAAKKQETASFFEYMKAAHMNYSKMPIVLKTMLTYNRLPTKYFEGLISNFSEKEFVEEEQRIQSIRLSNVIPKILRNLTVLFSKINIF